MKFERRAEPNRREWLVATVALLAGCGGVDSGGTGTGTLPTLAVGAITGFGSIVVNGVRFDDTLAIVEGDDGRVRTREQLRLGMRTEVIASAVSVVGGASTAMAASIRIRSELQGPVESIDTQGSTLRVLGQTVALVGTTVLDIGAVPLAAGDLVEIHATRDLARGRYVASRIERRASLAAYMVRGTVSALDLDARTIDIGGLRISWASAPPADPASALAPGKAVRVTLAPASGATPSLALAIDADAIPLDDRDSAEIEGRITSFTSLTDFSIDGIPVDARGATFEGGAAGIAPGAKVEVKGSLRGGVLLASKVEFEDDEGDGASFELHGAIQSADPAAMRFVVRGVTVVWSVSTRFDSGSAADLVTGASVEVRGRLSSDRLTIDATLIHLEP
ncbi:MAG: DUF5666 domain-containing protein [Aquincola sp.]|nr:DUF5666 domain-containing protein [Aquincola sp.]